MKKYLVDTNVLLRFFLKDNLGYYNEAKKYLIKAKEKEIELILIPEVIFEIDYVLAGFYSLGKKERIEILANLIKSPALNVVSREVIISAIEKYQIINIDLFDLYLYYLARSENAEALSFDKDFRKLKI